MYYSGIGSRSTPENILHMMGDVAYRLANKGWILRSGGADGADNAFEQGHTQALEDDQTIESPQIFLPWTGFNGRSSWFTEPAPWTYDIAERFHPRWKYLKRGAKLLHARNVHQVLGPNEDSEHSAMVLCYYPSSSNMGGTGQAVRIAEGYGIPVFNFGYIAAQRYESAMKIVLDLADKQWFNSLTLF